MSGRLIEGVGCLVNGVGRFGDCVCATGCPIPYDCLLVAWTNYDSNIHFGGPTVGHIRKPTATWKTQAGYTSEDCVWIDDDTGGNQLLLTVPFGFGDLRWYSGGFETDGWTHNGTSDAPHHILGNYENVYDFGATCEFDVTITEVARVCPIQPL